MLRGHRGRGREVALLRGTSLAPRRRLRASKGSGEANHLRTVADMWGPRGNPSSSTTPSKAPQTKRLKPKMGMFKRVPELQKGDASRETVRRLPPLV